ncbi:uncharacterized protein LOC113333325 isoform X2 [Papaver somniferum]|uniref:uncharacterized protein LOC113333325 isoform X2 n=1 Tax=Papaver somniferum TaxID=3469 RepID=UPI000E6F47F2|nr:uncharacterized protein LOC113333325 isoform X2 [Papaver somniferum]
MRRKKKEKIVEQVEIEADSEKTESDEETMIPVKKANKGASKKNIKCKSKKSSTSEIDLDEKEGGSNHNNSDEEEVYSGDRPYKAGLSALTAFVIDMRKENLNLNAQQIEVLKESPFADLFMMIMENEYTTALWNKIDEAFTKLLTCLKEATRKEIMFEFVRGGEKYTMTSTPEKLVVILGVPCIKGRWKETKKAMYGDSFRESEFYLRYFGDEKSASKTLI